MAGNLWEWCGDWYAEGFYLVSPEKDPVNTIETGKKVMRGGSFNMDNAACAAHVRCGILPSDTERLLRRWGVAKEARGCIGK